MVCVREEVSSSPPTGGAQGSRRKSYLCSILPLESIIVKPLFVTKYHNHIIAHIFCHLVNPLRDERVCLRRGEGR